MEVNPIKKYCIPVLLCALPIFLFLSMIIGSSSIGIKVLWEGLSFQNADSSQIVYGIRMPRLVMTLLTGLTLSLSGWMMQTVSQNRLASPSMLGLVDGALLGVVIGKSLKIVDPMQLPLFAIVGGFLVLGLVFLLAKLIPGGFIKMRLVLVGIIIGNIVSSLANIIAYKSSIFQQASLYFLGTVTDTTWQQTLFPLGALLLSIPLLVYLIPQLEGFFLDEELLKGIGKPVGRIKIFAFILSAILSAVTISVVGKISFVGLIVPNIVYLLKEKSIFRQFIITGLLGCLVILIADIGAKLIRYPYETPLSFVVSLIGLPFFFWIIKKRGGSHD